ncbi:MAG: hypothetical protein H0W88_04215 [Parachlamydiaceae bacterium]|nr:hypothetical protein [Parachlamydiaceae bacterium]
MTNTINIKEDIGQVSHSGKAVRSSAEEQILHLKRLLVTLKQQYEKNLHALNDQLQGEINQRYAIQKDAELKKHELEEVDKQHEEELSSLKQQLVHLRNLAKKNQEASTQEPANSNNESYKTELVASQQRIEQLERVIPYLRERTEEANLETEQLREELEQTYHKIKALQSELSTQQQLHEKLLKDAHQKKSETTPPNEFDTKSISENNSFEGSSLKDDYTQVLKEKVSLEYQIKELKQQSENQSSNIVAFQEQLAVSEQQKKHFEMNLYNKDQLLVKAQLQVQELEKKMRVVGYDLQEQNQIHEKYEQLREEFVQVSEKLDEAVETRQHADQQLVELTRRLKDQDVQLCDQDIQITEFKREQDRQEREIQRIKSSLDDSEGRFKVAQQHLGKKVKELALLNDKSEEQHMALIDAHKQLEMFKSQIILLQGSIESYQKHEKKLQEDLHDALKSTESQVSKWEEKYFKMYDKWQESEGRIRELKKIEEKHNHMQSLFANLGTFMGSSFASTPLYQAAQKSIERPTSVPEDFRDVQESQRRSFHHDEFDGQYDLFGVRQTSEKFKANQTHE